MASENRPRHAKQSADQAQRSQSAQGQQQAQRRQQAAQSQSAQRQQQRVAGQQNRQAAQRQQQQRIAGQQQAAQRARQANQAAGQGTRPVNVQRAARQQRAQGQRPTVNRRQAMASHGYSAGGDYAVRPSSNQAFESAYKPSKRQSRAGRNVAIIVIILLVIIVLFAALLGMSAFKLKDAGQTAMSDFTSIKSEIIKGDYDTAASKCAELQTTANEMQSELDSPVWAIAKALPVLGDDVSAAVILSDTLKTCADDVLSPLTTTLKENPPDDLVKNGNLNVSAVTTLMQAVESCAPAMQTCAAAMDSLPTTHIGQVTDLVDTAKDKFDKYNGLLSAAVDFAPVVNSVLGGNGTRTYMVVAQNTAETRSTGGFVGAYGMLTITNGKISLGEFTSPSNDVGLNTASTIEWTDEERAIFDSETHLTLAWNVGYNPDIERCCEVWAASYEEMTGEHVDGVISANTTIVQALLGVVGEITLSDGTTMNGDNATKVLQHDLYWKYLQGANGETADDGNATVDALFAEAAEKTFDGMVSSLKKSNLTKYLDVAQTLIANREMFVWFADDQEEALAVSNGLITNMADDPLNPQVGVYFNAAESSKVGWYCDMNTEVGAATTNADGTTSYKVTTTITNTATQTEADEGGAYIMGRHFKSYGDLDPYLYIYAPVGGSISDFTVSSGETFSEGTHKGHEVRYYNGFSIAPGTTCTITYTITCAAGAAPLGVLQNPLLTEYR